MKKALFILAIASAAFGYMMLATPVLANDHDDICQSNYNQCMNGCDGATSCSNQCLTNYNGCIGQGG